MQKEQRERLHEEKGKRWTGKDQRVLDEGRERRGRKR